MVNLTLLLLVLALVFAVLNAVGKAPLWIAVVLLAISALVSHPFFVLR